MPKLKFLLDSNLSWETAEFLKNLGYNVKTARELNLGQAEDIEIAKFAQKYKRIIVTLDLDFGEIYYFGYPSVVGIIVLRLENQTIESVNRSLEILLASTKLGPKIFQNSLIIFDGVKIRTRRKGA